MKKMQTNRTYKSRIFEMIFSDPKELLSLYNAVNGTHYQDPELLEINTLENAIYMAMYNDISFLIDLRLNLYEHQSTHNPNLPLRFLMYIADLFSDMTKDENLYGRKLILLPTPRFIVFYNGEEERPEREILSLSSAFWVQDQELSLELKAIVLNINQGHNENLMKACRTLSEYSEYTARVRKYTKEMAVAKAVEQAVTECIEEGILAEFLSKNRAEAMKVSIYEYDQEKHLCQEREASREEGIKVGRKEGIKEGMLRGRSELIWHALERGAEPEKLQELLGVTEEELEAAQRKLAEDKKLKQKMNKK